LTVPAAAQKFTKIANFNGANGESPDGGLVKALDGNLFGTTRLGGTNVCLPEGSCGTIFGVTPGALTTLHTFSGTDGANPYLTLVLATDGNLYGVTQFNGANNGCSGGCGTIFRFNTDGSLTTLYNLSPEISPVTSLLQSADGSFYGTHASSFFRMTLHGVVTVLHSFTSVEGRPNGIVQATDGYFYGTAADGGIQSSACSPTGGGCGTIFRIGSGGELATLHYFKGPDGAQPEWNLIQA
jgi:uncharacterized repeat protein (TIGR03803 family)